MDVPSINFKKLNILGSAADFISRNQKPLKVVAATAAVAGLAFAAHSYGLTALTTEITTPTYFLGYIPTGTTVTKEFTLLGHLVNGVQSAATSAVSTLAQHKLALGVTSGATLAGVAGYQFVKSACFVI